MSKPEPEKQRQPAASAERRIFPMALRTGDRITDETGEWEIIARPYTTIGGKNARVRVQRVGDPTATELRTWGAHGRRRPTARPLEHSPTSATGTAWERTQWHATQRAAWEALDRAHRQ